MKKKIIAAIMLITLITALSPDLRGEDYQYQYFTEEKDKYVPFSDYIPRIRMHQNTHPHFLEDYYQLYGMKLYYNENSLRKNIEMLRRGLNSKFRHPSNAIVKVETEQEYLKYRKLMFMHMNILIMRNYMRIAVRYDMQKIYFYNAEYAEEISESLKIAEQFYKDALPYWREAKKHATEASRIRLTTKLSNIESERYSIISGELDFEKIINRHIRDIALKQAKLQNYLASAQN